MTHSARINLAADQPDDVVVLDLTAADRRLVTGLEAGPHARATYLADDLMKAVERSTVAVVVDMRAIDWIDSGACAVLVKFWKALRANGRAVALCVTPPVRETFQVTGLVRLIPCFGELEQAVEAARTAQPSGTGE
jgi:anti-anti-sigma factor